MKNYNDFALPTDFFINKYNEEYEKNKINKSNNIDSLFYDLSLLLNNIKPLTEHAKNMDEIYLNLSICMSNLELLYPDKKSTCNASQPNLFILLHTLSSLLNKVIILKNAEARQFYLLTLNKIITRLSDTLTKLLYSISKKNIKIFKHM